MIVLKCHFPQEDNVLHRKTISDFLTIERKGNVWIYKENYRHKMFGCVFFSKSKIFLSNFKALQRRHQNLEREMKPIEEKMKYLKELAEQVKKAYPSEAATIDQKLRFVL